MALQVEKTSKRGGRIIHEKDMMPPPQFAIPSAPISTPLTASSSTQPKPEPSITEIMREPSKVVLLRVNIISNFIFQNKLHLFSYFLIILSGNFRIWLVLVKLMKILSLR